MAPIESMTEANIASTDSTPIDVQATDLHEDFIDTTVPNRVPQTSSQTSTASGVSLLLFPNMPSTAASQGYTNTALPTITPTASKVEVVRVVSSDHNETPEIASSQTPVRNVNASTPITGTPVASHAPSTHARFATFSFEMSVPIETPEPQSIPSSLAKNTQMTEPSRTDTSTASPRSTPPADNLFSVSGIWSAQAPPEPTPAISQPSVYEASIDKTTDSQASEESSHEVVAVQLTENLPTPPSPPTENSTTAPTLPPDDLPLDVSDIILLCCADSSWRLAQAQLIPFCSEKMSLQETSASNSIRNTPVPVASQVSSPNTASTSAVSSISSGQSAFVTVRTSSLCH